jgi:flagellin-like hook-associated protein FlgL
MQEKRGKALALALLMTAIFMLSIAVAPLATVRAGVTGNLQLTVDKTKGSPDEVVTVSGIAPIGAMVYVDFVRYTGKAPGPGPGNYTVITSTPVSVGTGGAFKTLITVPHVPMSDETHKYAIYAYVPGFEANTYDYVLFTVVPRLTISPKTTVTPGEVINVTGAGFPESTTIRLRVPWDNTYYVVGEATTDNKGDFVFPVSWEVKDLPKGTYNVIGGVEVKTEESISFTPNNATYSEVFRSGVNLTSTPYGTSYYGVNYAYNYTAMVPVTKRPVVPTKFNITSASLAPSYICDNGVGGLINATTGALLGAINYNTGMFWFLSNVTDTFTVTYWYVNSYTAKLSKTYIVNGTVILSITVFGGQTVTLRDDGKGNLLKDATVVGAINYMTGDIVITNPSAIGWIMSASASYEYVNVMAYAPFIIIPGLYYWNYDAQKWVSLYTISGTWTRDIELGILPLKVWGRGFEAKTKVASIVIRNIYYEYSRVVQNYTTMPLTTATNGSFRADLKLNLTPGGTYDAIVTTLEAYTFKGSLTINPYIEAYDYSKYSVTFGIDGRYTIEATRIPSLKITYASAQVIVFGWAFAPGTVTVAGTTTTVPATFFLDYIENKLVIATVINGTKIDDYTFLPDSNGFSAAIVVMPPSVTRGGHEIGQLQSITVPRLQFSARTNIWVGPTAFLSPLNGTVGPYTTIPYEFRGVGVVKGSIVGPFACLISGNRTCYSSTPGGKITYNPELYEEVKKGLGTEITVWGSGFDPNMDVYVFVRSTSFDLRTLYTSYFSKYGSLLQGLVPDGLLVANTTTDRYGSFKVKFVMPTLPGADYSIVVLVKTIAGGYEQVVAGSFTVIPGLFLNPAIAVGPYVAQVISTGNPYGTAGAVKGVAFRTTNFDSIYGGKYKQDFTDGIMGVNGHVVNWRITANGTLMSILSPYVYPGLFIPTLETGVYEVALILPDGSLTSPVHIGVINDLVLITEIHDNVVEIATKAGTILASLDSIAKSLSGVNAKLESIEGGVATIKTDVATIKADISALKPVITKIDGNVATISTTLGGIKADISALKPVVTEIKDGVATVNTAVGAIKGKVDTIDGNVATIRTDVGTIKATITDVKAAAGAAQSAAKSAESVASSLMIPVWIAAAFAIIATIIAIVSVVLIQRKIAK